MANIAISELNTEVTRISNDDLLLVSKYNSNGTFTSAKIKAQNVGDTSKRITTDANEIVVYISPTGSDNNIDSQYLNFGKDTQSNYPLFTITQACKLIDKILQLESSGRHAIIKCYAGTYNYNEEQVISGDYRHYGSYIRVEPVDLNQNVIFKQNYDFSRRNTVFFNVYCNAILRKVSVIGSDNWRTHAQNYENSHGIVSYNSRLTLYGVEISNFYVGFQGNDSSTIYVRSNYTNQGTIETIETNHTPTYIHDCYFAFSCYSSKFIQCEGWLRMNCDYAINTESFNEFDISSTSNASGSDYSLTRVDIKIAQNIVNFSTLDLPSMITIGGNSPTNFQMNIFKQGTTFTDVANAFGVEAINVENPNKSMNVVINNTYIPNINLNVDKF